MHYYPTGIPPDHRRIVPILRHQFFWVLLFTTYSILLALGSLYPLGPWDPEPLHDISFLWAPWPQHITRTDLLTNFLIYVPWGLFSLRAFFGRHPRLSSWLQVCVYATLFSALLEMAQLHLPYRVASNVDITLNAIGAALGAALAPFVTSRRGISAAIIAWRYRWFQPQLLIDAGLILLGVWLITQVNLQVPSLLAGKLHSGFTPFWDTLAWDHFQPAKTFIYALEIVSLGLFIGILLQPDPRFRLRAMGLTLVAVVLKMLIAGLLIKAALWVRLLSLEALLGMGLGLGMVWAMFYMRDRTRLYPATAGFLCAFILVKLGYGAPFLTATGMTPDLAIHPGLLFNITGIAFLSAEAWPYLVLACTLALWEKQS